MTNLKNPRIGRGLLAVVATALCFAIVLPAGAQEKDGKKGGKKGGKQEASGQARQEKINFDPTKDVSSWFWSRQVDQEVTTPVTLPAPIPPVSQRARLPNPQRPDTLPVALNQGQVERMSAIKFELLFEGDAQREVHPGSEIKKMEFFIEESADRNEHPSFRPEAAKIQACLIQDFLPQGENEQFEDAPKYSETDCAPGTREAVTGAVPGWKFDLTKLAEGWGKDPFQNYGVMLVPVVEAGATWQVNLKIPRKEAPSEEGDQYELTKHRAFITLDYIPGEPLGSELIEDPIEAPTTPTDTAPTTGGTTTSTFPSSSTTSDSPLISPSTDLTGTSTDIPAPEVPAVPTEVAGFGIPQEQGPRMPAYVWLAIPLGLLALSAVRSVVVEPAGGPRPDGVISAIRRRNAQRRGGALYQRRGGKLAGVSAGLKRGTGNIGKALSGATKAVRRKR